jgi:DNA-3-methyladenine glycosylase II
LNCFQVKDLATKFANGELSPQKLFKANDEELAEMLIAVRGIGRVRILSYSNPDPDH